MMKNLFKAFLVLIFFLLIAEGLLRVLGHKPHQKAITKVASIPSKTLVGDERLGLRLNPGTFDVHLNEVLEYHATHLTDGSRICGNASDSLPAIHIYGCSLSYGMGLSDEKVFPFLLQNEISNYKVKNYSVPGYGTVQSWMWLKEHLEKNIVPEKIIIAYSGLHDARNQMSGIQQMYWSESLQDAVDGQGSEIAFPYVDFKWKKLELKSKSLTEFDRRWQLSSYSVLIKLLENACSNVYYGFTKKQNLSREVITEIARLCKEHNIELLVLGMDQMKASSRMEKFLAKSNIKFVSAGIDILNPDFNLAPFDSHPNEKAHEIYKEKLLLQIQ